MKTMKNNNGTAAVLFAAVCLALFPVSSPAEVYTLIATNETVRWDIPENWISSGGEAGYPHEVGDVAEICFTNGMPLKKYINVFTPVVLKSFNVISDANTPNLAVVDKAAGTASMTFDSGKNGVPAQSTFFRRV